jgi:hypothetical protein
MFNRDKVIEVLVDDDLDGGFSYFAELLTTGFKGYDNFSDEELMQECDDRDISYLFGDDDVESVQ